MAPRTEEEVEVEQAHLVVECRFLVARPGRFRSTGRRRGGCRMQGT